MARSLLALLVVLALPAPARADAPAKSAELPAAVAALQAARAKVDPKRFAITTWSSPELTGPLLASDQARVGIQLPRREAECLARTAKCWLVVFLPGFDGSPESFAQGSEKPRIPSLADIVDGLDQRPGADPIVVVVLDGRTRLGGGWYVDSPASGRWESLVMQVLLPAAREALAPGTPPERTILAGHSMGGFGALHLGAAHPKSFHAVAAFEPLVRPAGQANDVLAKLEVSNAQPDPMTRVKEGAAAGHFYERVFLAMGAAFFPDPDPKAPNRMQPLYDPAHHPWRLSEAAQAAFDKVDLVKHADDLLPLAHVDVYGGRADRLIPLQDLEALANAANDTPHRAAGEQPDAGAGPGRRSPQVKLTVTDGDHVNHLAVDLQQALTELAR